MHKPDHEKEYVKDEIRKEFQLERMILFSDAVFAIVITLMAIEIRLPEMEDGVTMEELRKNIIHLLPNVIAYTASFIFIGFTWYQHLRIFSLLKDYDKGLVFRNMILLFFIGFFPFSASLVARPKNATFLIIIIYFSIIVLCRSAQLVLQHYILVKRPQLRLRTDIHEEMLRFKKSRFVLFMLFIMFLLVMLTSYFIPDQEWKNMAWWWFFIFPVILRFYNKKNT